MYRKKISLLLTLLLAVSLLVPTLPVQASKKQDPELWKVLRPLDKVVSFMNTGAHPDDEFSALLAWLSLGQGVRTSSLLANRGEGGQNEIGAELDNGLGIIRSRELQEASHLLGTDLFLLSEQIDDPIYDFGFSKSPAETLDRWGEEVVYERLIRRIREQRPDILLPSFRDVPSEHGHHRAISQLSLKAFADAANPKVFPQHRKQGLHPWQIKKLYLRGTPDQETLRFNIGKQDPVYGLTYPQLGEESRKLHKSQGMGRDLPEADYWVSLELVKSSTGKKAQESSLFAGIPVTLADLGTTLDDPRMKRKLVKLQRQLEQIQKAYPDRQAVTRQVQRTLKQVRQVTATVTNSSLSRKEKIDLRYRLQVKEEQLLRAGAEASKIRLQLTVDRPLLTRGATTGVHLAIKNGSTSRMSQLQVQPLAPKKWKSSLKSVPKALAPGAQANLHMKVKAPPDAAYFQPYQPSPLQVRVHYRLQGAKVTRIVTVDPRKQTVALLPDWGLKITPATTILNTEKEGERRKIRVSVTNHRSGNSTGTLRPNLPKGWKAKPSSRSLSFTRNYQQQEATFHLIPPKSVSPGRYTLGFTAEVEGRRSHTQVQPITYDHIGTSYLLTEARLPIQAFPLKFDPKLKVGYIESGFDQVADHLRQAGMDVTPLTEQELAIGDLSSYDTIVVGIRAYLSRPDLLKQNQRLLEYVQKGGHVVMQYHKPGDNWDPQLAPYPLTPGEPSIEWRITDENAPVTFLQPDHPLFQAPHRITEADFAGWVQERGLYFPSTWDSAYTPLLSVADPGEKPLQGGLLVADYGKGSYIYSSLVWYRQIQDQIPGGYRMFVNLIHYPRHR
ncbi:LmbE family N-acetylglucosaminyl deacetylase [Kroppenstedtia sanguinis]|uniref:NEW3 domain-containing protein n=1 Tax=Kroppenstedtia sanguinis TaxID=1380684 RepID=UPI003D1A412D